MRADNAAFALKNQARTKLARYTIEIAFDTAATDLYHFTSDKQENSAIPGGALVTYNVIENLSGASQQINPDEARATIGAIQFSLVDRNSAITSLFNTKLAAGKGLKGKRARIYCGYEGLSFSEYSLIQTQIIDTVSFSKAGYQIKCADVNRSARKDIFDLKKTTLSASIDATQVLIPVYKVTGFTAVAHGSSYSDAPNATVGYLRIEDEFIRWAVTSTYPAGTTTDGLLGLCFVADLRGALNSKAAAHTIDATATPDRRTEVKEHVYLELPAVKLAYAILTGQLHGQSANLPDNWHLAIPTSFVRLADFTGIGLDWWDTANDNAGFLCRFEGLEKQDGKAFLEKELYLLLGAFSPIYSTGEFGLKRMTGVLSGASHVVTLDRSNIVSVSDLTHDMQKVINQIQIDWNWDVIQKRFTRTNLLIDANSINTHGPAKLRRLAFRGLHGSRHSFAALTNRFNVLRDRYAGPPLLSSIRCLPRMNTLEVGDISRVDIPDLRDYTNNIATLQRAMEVQGSSINWITGEVSLNLFGSSQKASSFAPDNTTTPPLSDSWYSSAGTSLKTYIQANYGAPAFTESGGVGTITQSVTLPGGATLDTGIYYYLGDLVVASGITVSIPPNFQPRIKGHITINGKIDGKGLGLAGGVSGIPGFIGTTQAGGGILIAPPTGNFRGTPESSLVIGANSSVPNFELSTVGGVLGGAPTDLRGTSGGKGGDVIHSNVGVVAAGGNGAAGGSGLLFVCRGASLGVNGLIDLGGADGALGASYTNVQTSIAGTGAGGAPGACVFFLDGANSNIPDLGVTLSSVSGVTAIQGNRMADASSKFTDEVTFPAYSYYIGIGGIDMLDAAYRVQFLPESTAATNDAITPPQDVTGFSVSQNGNVVICQWTRILNSERGGYELRYHAVGTPVWASGIFLTREAQGTEITSASIPPGNWTVMIKAIKGDYVDGNYSVNPASFNILITNTNDIIFQKEQAPSWLGTIYTGLEILAEDGFAILDEDGSPLIDEGNPTFVRHWTGVLIPNSQDLASVGDWNTFDVFVPNPVPTSTYEAAEIDASFDAPLRVWSSVAGAIGPGEVGQLNALREIDYRLAAGIYDGFEPWTVGTITARFIKHRFTTDNTNGVAYVTSFIPVADVEERSEEGTNIIVAAGGTAITFAQAFHNVPNIQVTLTGATALIALADSPTVSGFTARVLNSAGTGIGGTVHWTARGA